MSEQVYKNNIVQYYNETEHAYKDSWDLDNSLAIHYGYWDETVRDFPSSLQRMNEMMMVAASIQKHDIILDAGCGVGGSSIFLAKKLGCRVTGITLSERQAEAATRNAQKNQVADLVDFQVKDYCNTGLPPGSFDVIWGCESICYAYDKSTFIREAYRLLKSGGRLVIADGFVTKQENNKNPVMRKWLDGWQVNYLETTSGFSELMHQTGFRNISISDISNETWRSVKRLYRFYWLASLYLIYKKINFSKPATEIQKKNIAACRYQYLGRKKKLWGYGLLVGEKPKLEKPV